MKALNTFALGGEIGTESFINFLLLDLRVTAKKSSWRSLLLMPGERNIFLGKEL